ncbi:Tyrosine-protein phosphatase non-receptor type 4 [Biomphalaria glabrata]|nr:prothoracicostatic peptide [Biomphalaria glabrata]
MVPAVLGGSLKSLFAEIEEDLKENMFREEKDDQPDEDWGDKKDWGEMKGWGDKKSWDDLKGWGDKKSWRDHKSRGWENRRQDRDDDSDSKESDKELVSDFRRYVRMQAMKEAEEKEAKAEVYRQMERVQMKKYLSEKMEELTENFEAQRMKFVFQTTVHFLSLCQGGSNAKEMLEELDDGQLGDKMVITLYDASSGNETSSGNDTVSGNETLSGNDTMNNNGTVPDDTNTMFDGTHLKWFAEMEKEAKIKYLLHGYMMSMCAAAQRMTGEIQMLELQIDNCRKNVGPCGDLMP